MTGRRPELVTGGDPPMRTHPDAACRRVQDPDMFYPERCDEKSARPAVKVCSRCPLRWEVCLPWALEHEREWGIWAGLTPGGRRAFARYLNGARAA